MTPHSPLDEHYKFMAFNNTRDEDTPDDSPRLREFSEENNQNW
jgi:hypothetical protein